MQDSVRDELAWAINYAEHEYAARLVHGAIDQADANFWLGAAHGLRLGIAVALGEPALIEVQGVADRNSVIDDGMAVSA